MKLVTVEQVREIYQQSLDFNYSKYNQLIEEIFEAAKNSQQLLLPIGYTAKELKAFIKPLKESGFILCVSIENGSFVISWAE